MYTGASALMLGSLRILGRAKCGENPFTSTPDVLAHDFAGSPRIMLFDGIDQGVVFSRGVARVELASDPQVSGPLVHVQGGHHDVFDHRIAGAPDNPEVETGVGAAVVDAHQF